MAAKQFLAVGLALSVLGLALLRPEMPVLFTALGTNKITAQSVPEKAAPKLDRISTSSILPLPTGNTATFENALNALSDDDYSAARNLRDSLPKDSLAFETLNWAMAYFAGSHLPSEDIKRASALKENWPGADILQQNRERALSKENLTPVQIIDAFSDKSPLTFEGALLLARAQKSQNNAQAAVSTLTPFWQAELLEPDVEKAVIDEFGAMIPVNIHQNRMQKMLFEARVAAAGRVSQLAQSVALYKAWSAVIRKDKAAGKLLEAVPQNQHFVGFYYAKARYLRRQNKITTASDVMLMAPRELAGLIDPDAWWNEQQILARDLLDLKKYDFAYQIAASHVGGSPAKQSEAAFLTGWIALQFLKDAPKSMPHFKQLAAITDGPISQARAYYWLGRAVEAGAEGDANAYFTWAASFATTYYGQLAAAKLALKTLNIATPAPTETDRKRFEGRKWVQAARMLIDAGHAWRATPLIDALADKLSSPEELALLAEMATNAGQTKLALQVGKSSAYRGVDVGALTHPLGAIPEDTQLSDAGRALAYAIARQESEFHVGAKSGAGALGLLQLLPGTAKDVAKRVGLEYSQVRLAADGGYNATLGARYLSEQIDRFDGSYILTFIAYNAGPRRAEDWVKRYGNPKGKSIEDVVDWVERIPFSETRSYVQRVMENYQVYKWRLNGQYDIVQDLRFGRK